MGVERGASADLQRLANDLNRLRVEAGITSLRSLAKLTHYSHTSISQAVGGKDLPSLAVTLAFVRACGGDQKIWQQRWQRVYAAVNSPTTQVIASQPWPPQAVADGADPLDSGCYLDAVTVRATRVAITARRHIIGTIELRYSPDSHAAWGRFKGDEGLDKVAMHRHAVDLTIGVVREIDHVELTYQVEYGFDNHWGDLVTTGDGLYYAWVTVRFDGAQIAHGETGKALLA